MYKTSYWIGKKFVTRHVSVWFVIDVMYQPVAQEHIIEDQVKTLIALDFYNEKDIYIELKKNLDKNWELLDLVDIPRNYIYNRKKQQLRRY